MASRISFCFIFHLSLCIVIVLLSVGRAQEKKKKNICQGHIARHSLSCKLGEPEKRKKERKQTQNDQTTQLAASVACFFSYSLSPFFMALHYHLFLKDKKKRKNGVQLQHVLLTAHTVLIHTHSGWYIYDRRISFSGCSLINSGVNENVHIIHAISYFFFFFPLSEGEKKRRLYSAIFGEVCALSQRRAGSL